jgi:hypothetical protein
LHSFFMSPMLATFATHLILLDLTRFRHTFCFYWYFQKGHLSWSYHWPRVGECEKCHNIIPLTQGHSCPREIHLHSVVLKCCVKSRTWID